MSREGSTRVYQEEGPGPWRKKDEGRKSAKETQERGEGRDNQGDTDILISPTKKTYHVGGRGGNAEESGWSGMFKKKF